MALFRWARTGERARLVTRAPPGPLRDYLAAPAQPVTTPLSRARLLAVDVETTGLDPARDQLLSIGFVAVDGQRIALASAVHTVVRPPGEVGDSALIHGLTDDVVARGVPLPEALGTVLEALRGRVLLAHHAPIETGFLARACQQVYGCGAVFDVVDTMVLQAGLLTLGFDEEPPPGSLRLWGARGQYGLPNYAAHDALWDAISCAELYLAQAAELQVSRPLALKAVVNRS